MASHRHGWRRPLSLAPLRCGRRHHRHAVICRAAPRSRVSISWRSWNSPWPWRLREVTMAAPSSCAIRSRRLAGIARSPAPEPPASPLRQWIKPGTASRRRHGTLVIVNRPHPPAGADSDSWIVYNRVHQGPSPFKIHTLRSEGHAILSRSSFRHSADFIVESDPCRNVAIVLSVEEPSLPDRHRWFGWYPSWTGIGRLFAGMGQRPPSIRLVVASTL